MPMLSAIPLLALSSLIALTPPAASQTVPSQTVPSQTVPAAPPAPDAAAASLPPDARFALALYCDPTCSDDVLNRLEEDLASIQGRSGFPATITRPGRIMGIADTAFGIPDQDVIDAYGVGVDRPESLARSEQVVLAWFAAPVSGALPALTTAHGAFARAAAASGGWIEDLDTQQIFGAAAWTARDPARLAPGAADPAPLDDWFVIDGAPVDAADPDGPIRLVTRGLRRVGLPDLVVESIDPGLAGDVSTVLNATALGLYTRAARSPDDLRLQTATIDGAASFAAAARRDDDPEAPLWRLSFDGQILAPAPDPVDPDLTGAAPAGQVAEASPILSDPAPIPALISAPIPAPISAPISAPILPAPIPAPALTSLRSAPADLQDAQEQAMERLSGVVLPAVRAGLPPREAVACSLPFETRDGSTEYMWVELRSVNGDELTGVLVNEPYNVEGLRKGDTIAFQLDEVFDYIWKRADGSREGNTTAKFL